MSDGSFRMLAEACLPSLYRSAYFYSGDRHQAEDLVQEALTRVFVQWSRKQIDDPVAYAHRTLLHVFLSARRKRSSHEYPTEFVPDRHAPVDDVTTRLDLRQALTALKPLDRAIVVLRYLDDRSVEEVAGLVGTSPGNVRVRASRALTRLRADLGDIFRNPPQEVGHD